MQISSLAADAALQGIRLGRASFQKVKQALRHCRAFELNLNIVQCTIFLTDLCGAIYLLLHAQRPGISGPKEIS